LSTEPSPCDPPKKVARFGSNFNQRKFHLGLGATTKGAAARSDPHRDGLGPALSMAAGAASAGRLKLTRPISRKAIPMGTLTARLMPILLLVCSNVFMTFAWYGHLRFKDRPLWLVILVSWGIALFEYCLAVPANRFGSNVYSAAELKAMQEVITLIVFAVFAVIYLGQKVTISQVIGFALIAAGAFFIFRSPIH
jgi:uncharacterized protein